MSLALAFLHTLYNNWSNPCNKHIELLDCWRVEVLRRLELCTTMTTINLAYWEELESSLWRLKQGEWLDSNIINVYIELLRTYVVFLTCKIVNSFTLEIYYNWPYTWFTKLLNTGIHTIYFPVN